MLKALAVIYKRTIPTRENRICHRTGACSGIEQECSRDEGTSRVADAIKEARLGRTQFGSGPGHHLHAQALGHDALFLRQAGAPLDNNICERAVKKVVLHRKRNVPT